MPQPKRKNLVDKPVLDTRLTDNSFPSGSRKRDPELECTIKNLASHDLLLPKEEYQLGAKIRARILLIHRELLKLPGALELGLSKVKDLNLRTELEAASVRTAAAFSHGDYGTIRAETARNYSLLRPLYKDPEANCFGGSDVLRLEEQLKKLFSTGAVPGVNALGHEYLLELKQRVASLREEIIPLSQQFAESNTRLVLSVVGRHFKPRQNEKDDVIADGNLGLLRAIERFDPKRGYKFSTYATWWIKQAIRDSQKYGLKAGIRIPAYVKEIALKIRSSTENFVSFHGREPSSKELASWMQTTQTALAKELAIIKRIPRGALFSEVFDTDKSARRAEDLLGEESSDKSVAATDELRAALELLNDNERELIRLAFGDTVSGVDTLDKMGEHLKKADGEKGLTREGVRQMKLRALKKLRDIMEGE